MIVIGVVLVRFLISLYEIFVLQFYYCLTICYYDI